MTKEIMPDYPLFGESLKQYQEWHLHRFCALPTEKDIKLWRKFALENVIQRFPILKTSDRPMTTPN